MEQNWYAGKMPGEIFYDEIQRKAENGEFREWNYQSTTGIEYGYEDLKSKLESYTAVEYLGYQEKRDAAKKAGNTADAEKWQGEMDRMINEVYDIYRSRNVYPTAYFSEIAIMDEISKCCAYKAFWTGDTVSCGAGVGTTLCKFLFPNLQDTPSKHDLDKEGAESIFAKFHNEKYLKRAIQFCFSYKNGCPVPTAVEGGLRLVGSAPSNFRPMNAKAIYERFAPAGGIVYDPCCVDGETEYWTGTRWKKIKDYVEGDLVLQYNEDGTAELVKPLRYIKYQSDAPFYLYKQGAFNTCLTGNHSIVYRSKRDNYLNLYRISQGTLASLHREQLKTMRIPSFFEYSGGNTVLDEERRDFCLLALLTQFCAKTRVLDKTKGVFSSWFKYKSPLNRVVLLLKKMGLQYNVSVDKLFFNSDKLNRYYSEYSSNEDSMHLVVPDWFYSIDKASQEFLATELYIVGLARGKESGEGHIRFNTGIKSNADFIQFLFSSNGVSTSVSLKRTSAYTIEILKKDSHCYAIPERFSLISDPMKYCFEVPSHNLVLRRNDCIFVTGNCGFGGRLLGCLSSNKNFKYVGCDPNTETMYHLHQLADYIEMVTGRENSYELHCCGSEDMRGPANSVDFAFTSPPYFDLEIYSNEPTQCYNKFPELKQWLEGYVRATIKNIVYMLKPGRVYAINIADFSCGSETVHYVDEWARISAEEGAPLFDTVYLGVTARAGSKEQAAGELKKENILIFKKRA